MYSHLIRNNYDKNSAFTNRPHSATSPPFPLALQLRLVGAEEGLTIRTVVIEILTGVHTVRNTHARPAARRRKSGHYSPAYQCFLSGNLSQNASQKPKKLTGIGRARVLSHGSLLWPWTLPRSEHEHGNSGTECCRDRVQLESFVGEIYIIIDLGAYLKQKQTWTRHFESVFGTGCRLNIKIG